MKEIKFVIHEDGKASLYNDNCFIGQVGRCSGIELLEIFNKLMKENNLPYRMHSDYSFVKEILEEK